MSLTATERLTTCQELQANHDLSGLRRDEIQHDLGLTLQQLERTLEMRPTSDPAVVWLVRDYLERAIRDQGRDPIPFTVLDDSARIAASQWYRLRPPPPATRRF